MQAASLVKPKTVVIAVNLLWATLALGLVNVVLNYSAFSQAADNASAIGGMRFMIGILLFTWGFSAFLFMQISAGKNWSRITFLVMFVLGLLQTFSTLKAVLSATPAVGAITMLTLVFDVVALFLVFTSPGSLWFSKKMAQSPSCPKCLQPVFANEVFCGNCGNKVK